MPPNGARCCNCSFFEPWDEGDGRRVVRGSCMRFPPASDGRNPLVTLDRWCGEYIAASSVPALTVATKSANA
jgi:hypothetical protein